MLSALKSGGCGSRRLLPLEESMMVPEAAGTMVDARPPARRGWRRSGCADWTRALRAGPAIGDRRLDRRLRDGCGWRARPDGDRLRHGCGCGARRLRGGWARPSGGAARRRRRPHAAKPPATSPQRRGIHEHLTRSFRERSAPTRAGHALGQAPTVSTASVWPLGLESTRNHALTGLQRTEINPLQDTENTRDWAHWRAPTVAHTR